MNIKRSPIEKIVFTEIPSLDPITVMIDDSASGCGSITICTYGKAWTAYWGAMGERLMVEFFCDCNDAYLARKLSDIDQSVIDYDAVSEAIGVEVDETTLMLYTELVRERYGTDWQFNLPRKENPEFQYLRRIISAVQAGFREHLLVRA